MKKLIFILIPVLLLAAAGGAYEFVLAPKSASATTKKHKVAGPKIVGTLFPLAPAFIVNLQDSHYGNVTVALLLTKAPAAPAGGTATLPEDAAVRSVITDDLTGATSEQLLDRAPRHALVTEILRDLKRTTDVPVTEVLLTDIAIQ